MTSTEMNGKALHNSRARVVASHFARSENEIIDRGRWSASVLIYIALHMGANSVTPKSSMPVALASVCHGGCYMAQHTHIRARALPVIAAVSAI